MIVCFVGPTCAGKTTASSYVCSKTGMEFIEGSRYVRKWYKKSDFDGNLIEFVVHSYEKQGKDVFYRKMEPDIANHLTDGSVVISGFRTMEELEALENRFDDVRCIGIYADSKTRFKRCMKRDGHPSGVDYLSFLEKDFLEYGFGIARMLSETTDDIIVNEGSFDELYDELDEKVVELGCGRDHRNSFD